MEKLLRTEHSVTESSAAGATELVLIFTEPPGGALDPNGVFKNSIPLPDFPFLKGFGNTAIVDEINGNDTGPAAGSVGGLPFKTIAAAIAAVSVVVPAPGPTTPYLVWVLPGTYVQPVGLVVPSFVTLAGISDKSVIISLPAATTSTAVVTLQANANLRSVSLTGVTAASVITLAGVTLNDATATAENVNITITDAATGNIVVGAMISGNAMSNAAFPTLTNLDIRVIAAGAGGSGIGVYSNGSSPSTAYINEVNVVATSADSATSYGIEATGGTQVVAAYCIFQGATLDVFQNGGTIELIPIPGSGYTAAVDAIYGNDTFGEVNGAPFATIQAAIVAINAATPAPGASTPYTIAVGTGTFSVTGGITIPSFVTLTGVSSKTTLLTATTGVAATIITVQPNAAIRNAGLTVSMTGASGFRRGNFGRCHFYDQQRFRSCHRYDHGQQPDRNSNHWGRCWHTGNPDRLEHIGYRHRNGADLAPWPESKRRGGLSSRADSLLAATGASWPSERLQTTRRFRPSTDSSKGLRRALTSLALARFSIFPGWASLRLWTPSTATTPSGISMVRRSRPSRRRWRRLTTLRSCQATPPRMFSS